MTHQPTESLGTAAGDQALPVMAVRDVSKTYKTRQGDEVVALQNVSFDVTPGAFVSLLGPSGCGKTTMLKICAGLIAPTAGEIHFKDTQRPVDPGAYGIVFQDAALLPWRTILANVLFPAQILKKDKQAAKRRASDLLHLTGLSNVENKYPAELSGGMQQRASIARSLIHDPEILFMDEPFGALDALTRETLNMELQEIHRDQQKTILFVTHNIQEAVFLSDRILVLSSGPGELVADIRNPIEAPRALSDMARSDFRELERHIRSLLGRHDGDTDGRSSVGTTVTQTVAPR
jgi:NitT/TauT family transport system ATP-binding protein